MVVFRSRRRQGYSRPVDRLVGWTTVCLFWSELWEASVAAGWRGTSTLALWHIGEDFFLATLLSWTSVNLVTHFQPRTTLRSIQDCSRAVLYQLIPMNRLQDSNFTSASWSQRSPASAFLPGVDTGLVLPTAPVHFQL